MLLITEPPRHPRHEVISRFSGKPVPPLEPRNFLRRWQRRWHCVRSGGHWLHTPPIPGTGLYCCACGKKTGLIRYIDRRL